MKFLRFLLGIAFGTAGVLHFTNERQFKILFQIIYLYKNSCISYRCFEIFFGMMLLIQRPASWLKKGINLFLLAVFPANIYMARKNYHWVIKKFLNGRFI